MAINKAQANRAAATVLAYLGKLDSQWAERIQITKDEFHYDDLQTLGCYVANQLEQGLHTVIPRHPFFEPGFVEPSEGTECPVCHDIYKPAYNGQPVCSNRCATSFYAAQNI